MAETIRHVDYYYVQVSDKPGEGSRILSELKHAGVNLLAQCGFPAGRGKTQLDFVPEDSEAFRKTAKKLGLKLSDRKRAFLVQGDDRIGAVADVLERLASQQINVIAAQAVFAGSGRWGMIVWVSPGDFKRAGRSLGV